MKRVAIALCFVFAACGDDRPDIDYSSHEGVREATSTDFLPSPVRFDRTIPRLSFGMFYELASNSPNERRILQNNLDSFFFIFDLAGDGTGDFTGDIEETSDRVQGKFANRFVHGGQSFWGFQVFWALTKDISQYDALYVSLKSSSATYADIEVAVQSGPPFPSPTVSAAVRASTYGYVNDGQWHSLRIPVSDLEALGVDLRAVRVPFQLTGDAGEGGELLFIDDVFYQ